MKLKATNETEARTEAIEISNSNRGMYVTVSACFGLFASLSTRLNTFAPSDSCFAWYVRNGKVKTFTEDQRIADQNATPRLS